MPEANIIASSAPSSAAISASACCTDGIVGPAIDVAAAIAVVGVAQICGRHVDRRDQSLGHRLDHAKPLRNKCPGLYRPPGLIIH